MSLDELISIERIEFERSRIQETYSVNNLLLPAERHPEEEDKRKSEKILKEEQKIQKHKNFVLLNNFLKG